jgi:hypothetical protein
MRVDNYNSSNESAVLAKKTYTNINGTRDRNTWKFDSITFVVPEDTTKVRVVFKVAECSNVAYRAFLVKPMLVSGNKAQAWTGHPDEIYVGVVSITEKKGLMVEHSNVNTRTVMSAEGFSIEDNNGDVLAWLSSKEQWTELNIERIYAANIDNVYTKHKTLHVNHSYIGNSDGTAEKPFSSFNDLNQFLKLTPTINGHVNINVLSEGTITEEFVLEGLKGSGTLNVVINNNAIFQGENTREAGIKFVDVQLTINIETSATYIDFEHGVLLYNCGVTNITGLILNVSGYGVLCNNTNAVIHHVDFCDSYCCIGSTNCSNVHFYSCSGNDVGVCCRTTNGGIITIGGASASSIPYGDLENQGGYIYSKENVSKSSSWNYPNTSTLPSVPIAGTEYVQSYTHTSLQSYQYNWSSWSTDGSCKQGTWGYGLRGGHMFFDIATIRNEITGTIQDGNTITLTRANSGGISGDANVYINGSNCSSASGTPNYSNNTHLGTLKWGETKTFTLPKAIVQSLINGTCNSLAVYTDSTASNNYINITNASITLKTKK